MPKTGKTEGPHAANDNVEKPLPEMTAANDNVEGKHLREVERPEHEEGEMSNKALREMMGEIEEAPPGAVLFIAGVTSPRAWDERRSGHRAPAPAPRGAFFFSAGAPGPRGGEEGRGAPGGGASAQGYDEGFARKLESEEVVFITHDMMRGPTGSYENALVALEHAVKNNPGKKIVCDSNFLLQHHMFKPWEAEDSKEFGSLSTGKQSKESLERWLKDVSSDNPDAEAISKATMLEQRFAQSTKRLLDFGRRYLGGREMVFGLAADNVLALAFFVFATRGNLQPGAVRDVLGKFHGSKRAVQFIRIKDGKFITELEGRKFKARRVA